MSDLSAKLARVAGFIESMSREDRRWFKTEEASIREALAAGLKGGEAEKLVPACIGAYEAWQALSQSQRQIAEKYLRFATEPNDRAHLAVFSILAATRAGDRDLTSLYDELEDTREEASGEARARSTGAMLFGASQEGRDDDVEQLAIASSIGGSSFLCDQLAVHAINRVQHQRALALIDLSIKIASERDDDVWLVRGLRRLAAAPGLPIGDSVKALAEAERLAQEAELDRQVFWIRFEQARHCLLDGALEQALEHALWTVKAQPEMWPSSAVGGMSQLRLGDVYLARGQNALAARTYEHGLQHAKRAEWIRLRSRLRLRKAVAGALDQSAASARSLPQQHDLEGLRPEEVFAWEQLVRAELEELQTSASVESNPAWDVRIARHILALRRQVTAGAGPTVTWRVSADFSAVELEDGTTVRFRKRSPKRGILRRLIGAARKDREARVTTEALIEVAWPGQTFVGNSARGRLWTTLHRLRLDGLEEIESSSKGYRIAPNVSLVVA